MALFIIYSNLSNDHQKWKLALDEMVKWRHQVYLVTNKKRHELPPIPDNIHLVKNNLDQPFVIQIEEIKRIAKFADNDIIIGVSNAEKKALVVTAGITEKRVIIIDPPQKSYVEKAKHDKSHFDRLIRAARFFKHSNSEQFSEIHDISSRLSIELKNQSGTTPDFNLNAQIAFLNSVLTIAEDNPHLSKEECIMQVQKDYKKWEILTEVISAPINLPLFRLGIFKALTLTTETGALIQRTQKSIEEKQAVERTRIAPPGFDTNHKTLKMK